MGRVRRNLDSNLMRNEFLAAIVRLAHAKYCTDRVTGMENYFPADEATRKLLCEHVLMFAQRLGAASFRSLRLHTQPVDAVFRARYRTLRAAYRAYVGSGERAGGDYSECVTMLLLAGVDSLQRR